MVPFVRPGFESEALSLFCRRFTALHSAVFVRKDPQFEQYLSAIDFGFQYANRVVMLTVDWEGIGFTVEDREVKTVSWSELLPRERLVREAVRLAAVIASRVLLLSDGEQLDVVDDEEDYADEL